jgi:hypothetical protein
MLDVRRRQFITLLGGAAAWPLGARAQQPERMRRIGVLMAVAESDADVRSGVALFQQTFKSSAGRMAAIFELIIVGAMPMQTEFRHLRKSWSACSPMCWSPIPPLRPKASCKRHAPYRSCS